MTRLPCPPELWPEFSALLDTALELPESQRLAWLDSLGESHAAVKPWLRKVLATQTRDHTADFLDAPLVRELPDPEFKPQQLIGPYVLESLLGRGGMGEVWLASRSDGELKRGIALKLPHAHLLAGVQRRRFERERDILAMLTHPHIAQLYDAGAAAGVQPYLAMERVDGVPITQYCRDHRLSLPARIGLFRQVLDAVGYAHARLVAHRDLKPTNVLVTPDGRVKLLDFGIAKLLSSDGSTSDAADLTALTGNSATPDYAAPEQLRGEAVTAAADIYALGVMLFEVLAGRRPFSKGRGMSDGKEALPRASALLDAAHAALVAGSTPQQLRRALQGDLDAILIKALDPEPLARYRTAEAFAEDLQASLDHRPISARHIRVPALMWRFVQRHRIGVALAAALVLVMILGSAGIAWQAVRAQREAQRAVAIKDFLVSMFRASDPSVASDKPRGTITAKELVDLNAGRIERDFADDPAIAIDLLGIAASIYAGLEDESRYETLHQRYEALALQFYGPLHPISLTARLDDVGALLRTGKETEARALLDSTDNALDQAGLDHSELRATWWRLRAQSYATTAENLDARRVAFEQAIQLLEALGKQNSDLLGALIERGQIAFNALQYTDAERYFRRALVVGAAVQPPNDGEMQRAYNALAQALTYQGRSEEATALFEKAVALALRTQGTKNWHYWETVAQQARLLHQQGKRETAHALFEQLLPLLPAADDRTANTNSRRTVVAVHVQYARCLVDEGLPDKATAVLEPHVALAQTDLSNLRMRFTAAEARLALHEYPRARLEMQAVLAGLAAMLPEDSSELQLVRVRLAEVDIETGALQQATQVFEQAIAATGNSGLAAMRAQAALARIALARGNHEEALQRSRLALDVLAHSKGTYSVRLAPLLHLLEARALLAGGNTAAARQIARAAVERLRQYDSPGSLDLIEAGISLKAALED